MLGIFLLLSLSNIHEDPSRVSETEVVFPKEIITTQIYQCWSDTIELSYSYRPSLSDSFKTVKVNGKGFKKNQIDKLNFMLTNSNIDKISLFSCPMSKKDQHPIGYHLYLVDINNVSAKRGVTFFLTRNGNVK